MSRLLPPAALALSVNGFFLYLAVLDAVGQPPRTSTTAAWYALMGLLCLGGAVGCRDALVGRLRGRRRLVLVWVGASALLALWFLANVAFVSEGRLSRIFAALLILWSLPTAVLALSLPRPAFPQFAAAAAVLGGLFVLIETVSAARSQVTSGRFTAIAHLDPISAAQYPAIGAVALLALRPTRHRRSWAAGLALLVAGTILPGSRGPIVGLVAAAAVAIAFAWRRTGGLAVVAVAAGLVLGGAGTAVVGSSCYLTYSTPGTSNDRGCDLGTTTGPPISTFHIRREWWSTAARAVPDDPIVGHGVAMFVDDTPEAHRMGVAGTRTYPHNSPLESAYSLGAIGAVLYSIFVGGAVLALVLLARRRDATLTMVTGLWLFAFASANLSGEIGADAAVWAASALAVGIYADTAAAR